MSTLKIGFHAGPGGNHGGISNYYEALDNAGIPFFLKSVDHYGHCWEASQYSNAPHTIVFRLSTRGQDDGYDYDVPRYDLDPLTAADLHWTKTLEKLPPEFDKDKVWLEVINEVDKNRAEWLAEFAIYMATKALAQGYKIAMFGWSSGEPEKEHWSGPQMLAFLRICAANPDKIAIALHEYSYTTADILDGYPYKVGRFHLLHQVCSENDIARPTILITEWGWELNNVPGPASAMFDIDAVANLYALHKNILGAAIWYLGDYEDGTIANETQQLIIPVTNLALNTTYPDPIDPPPVDNGESMSKVTVKFYSATELLLSTELTPPEGTVLVSTDVLLEDVPVVPDPGGGDDDQDVPDPVVPPVTITDIVDSLPKHPTLTYGERAGGDDDVTVVTIHHTVSGSSLADITAIAGYHINTQGWPGIAYHYCITADGNIYQTNRLATKSYHSGGNNHYAIGVAILGDFTSKAPTALQLESATKLVDWLVNERLGNVNHIWGHRDMPTIPGTGTQCPGNSYLSWIGPIVNHDLPLPSTKFKADDQVSVTSSSALNLRSTPFGSVLASYPTGTVLRIVHPYCVRATGYVWWFVEVGGQQGWVAEDYIALVGTTPPPPPGQTVDVAPYFVPSGQYGKKIVMKTGSGTQPMQLEKRANDVILRKGDGNWIDNVRYQDSEQWRIQNGEVQKGKDTSDAGNGGRDGYDLGWAKWIPQVVTVGTTYNSTPTVKRFDRTNGCQVYSTSQADDYLTIKALLPSWTSPANPAIVLTDVLVIEWRSGTSDLSVPPNETYYFAKDIGYVGWNNNFIVEITSGQAPLSGSLDCGM